MRGLETLSDIVAARALFAAVHLGLWESLADGACSTDELADRHDLSADAVARVLDVLGARGWLRRSDQQWSIATEFSEQLEELPQSFPSYVAKLDGLERYLDEGTPPRPFIDGADYADVVDELHALFESAASELARRLRFRPKSVLDLGTGAGVFGIAIARRHDAERLVGFDRPEVVPRFERHAEEAGVVDVAVGWSGDFLVDALPAGFDCVFVCNVLRVLAPEEAERLIGRIPGVLDSRGRLIVVDVLGDAPRELSLIRSMYRLDLALRNDSGGPHDETQLNHWCRAAGFELQREFRLEEGPLGEMVKVFGWS